MFFTRSIRRKMVAGFALVLVMLMILSLSGISGLSSYRNVVNDLDYSINQAPHRAELVAAIGPLFGPLLLNLKDKRGSASMRQQEFQRQIAIARERVLDFRRKLDSMPPTPVVVGQQAVTKSLMDEVDRRLDHLETLQRAWAGDGKRDATAQHMLREVASLLTLVQEVPDPHEGPNDSLKHARNVYHSRFWIVGTMTALVVLLFGGLVWCGYLWIFAPIQTLHQGALRVAQGDFHYRVELKSHDEMAELADAFNKMTARFREITADLDRQVRDRSAQLVRSERLAGVGFLSAGVAHEINNPLSAIVMATDSLQGRMADVLAETAADDADVIRRFLDMIGREAFRCRQITARLLDFSRGQDAKRSRNDLRAIISEVLRMVQHMSKFRDRNILFTRTEPCHLEVNGPEIKQVVLNLVANALQAMTTGGELRIDITEQTDHVILTLEDDGCGMTPEVIHHLFEPFFTQNKTGKGTGLGLSISHRIIDEHGGTIEAASEGPGKGSTFRVHLPRKPPASDVAA